MYNNNKPNILSNTIELQHIIINHTTKKWVCSSANQPRAPPLKVSTVPEVVEGWGT